MGYGVALALGLIAAVGSVPFLSAGSYLFGGLLLIAAGVLLVRAFRRAGRS